MKILLVAQNTVMKCLLPNRHLCLLGYGTLRPMNYPRPYEYSYKLNLIYVQKIRTATRCPDHSFTNFIISVMSQSRA